MSTRRLGVAVAVLGGFLYAVGGSDGTSPLNTGVLLCFLHQNAEEFEWVYYVMFERNGPWIVYAKRR